MTTVAALTWMEFEKRAALAPYWVLAVGSIEQHGPHLPLGADTMVAETLARELCARDGALIAEVLSAGVLFKYGAWPGSLSLADEVVMGHVHAAGELAARHSNRLLIINAHDENHAALLIAGRRLSSQLGTDVVLIEWAELIEDVIREVVSSRSESHAGEALTSLLLHWRPELVRRDRIARGATITEDLTRDDLHADARAHHLSAVPPAEGHSGVFGDPTASTAESGAVIAAALVERVSQIVTERDWR